MTSYNDPKQRRKIIMDRYTNLHNKGVLEDKTQEVEQYSSQCVDWLKMSLKIENNTIIDAKFIGEGCAVFLSSTDLMLDKIKNKTINQAKEIAYEYLQMIQGKAFSEKNDLGELMIFANVKTHFNRLHCAEMVALAIEKII